jgi:hypothetical protein
MMIMRSPTVEITLIKHVPQILHPSKQYNKSIAGPITYYKIKVYKNLYFFPIPLRKLMYQLP